MPPSVAGIDDVYDVNTISPSAVHDIIGPLDFSGPANPIGLLADLQLEPWIKSLAYTQGGAEYAWSILRSPTTDTEIIRARTDFAKLLPSDGLAATMSVFKSTESAVLWLQRLPAMKDAWPLPLLFPLWPVLRLSNRIPIALDLFHLYRGYIAPCMHVIYPLTSMIAPFFYMRKTMKMKIALQTYLSWIKVALKSLLRLSGDVKHDLIRLAIAGTYAFVFFYGLIQSIEIASMIRSIRRDLLAKRDQIEQFMNAARPIRVLGNEVTRNVPTIPKGMSGVYALWNNLNGIRDKVTAVAREVYVLDTATIVHRLLTNGYCVPKFVNTGGSQASPTKFWDMGHPLLKQSQKTNPVSLERNIIITGPNAAGKTTYMKAVAANSILAQTLGVCYASKAIVNPVTFFGSFVRVTDEVGTASLFEAEVQRCTELLATSKIVSDNGYTSLLFLDEPMHSTPPIEGASTAMAVIQALGKMPGVRVLATTHYHDMVALEESAPDLYRNVSMEAIAPDAPEGPDGSWSVFKFPYTLRRGPSFQCIALELLRERELPEDVFRSAIEFKKQICKRVIKCSETESS